MSWEKWNLMSLLANWATIRQKTVNTFSTPTSFMVSVSCSLTLLTLPPSCSRSMPYCPASVGSGFPPSVPPPVPRRFPPLGLPCRCSETTSTLGICGPAGLGTPTSLPHFRPAPRFPPSLTACWWIATQTKEFTVI
eukprot:Lithocolla_globosa_v1_NODE_5556_length_1219_cov_11.776632.p2 type:complete len:136 gc:universal NODE_5556_length_1219_cov_11.776632:91-498(+)